MLASPYMAACAQRSKKFSAAWRRIHALVAPFWLADGYKSVLALSILGAFFIFFFFASSWGVSHVDFITRELVHALPSRLTYWEPVYALAATMGSVFLGYLCTRLWPKHERVQGYLLLAILLGLIVVTNSLTVIINIAQGAVITAMHHDDWGIFHDELIRLITVGVVSVPVIWLWVIARNKLHFVWAQSLANWVVDRYFDKKNHYRLSRKKIDNPDVREINTCVSAALELLLKVLDALITYRTFMAILGSDQVDPTHILTWAAYAWSVAFTLMALAVGARLKGLNLMKLRREADLASSLTYVHQHAEAVAFYGGEESEKAWIGMQLSELFNTWNEKIGWTRNLAFVQTGSEYLIAAVPLVFLGRLYFLHHLEIGSVVLSAQAFVLVISSLTVGVTALGEFASFSAGLDRFSSLVFALQEEEEADPNKPVIETIYDGSLGLERVTVMTPDYARTLVRDLSVQIEPGDSLLIMGRSGVGKSALLRVFRSMWRAGTGLVHSPNEEDIVFLPQRPYTVHADQGSPLERGSLAHRCSLEAQLLYPRRREIDEAQLQRVLEEVNLPYLSARTGGFKAVFDFGELSPGEQQKLAFARLLLAGPKFAMLDEATSALGEEDENNLYGLLVRYGITPGSVSHRTSLIKHHKYLLELDGDGGYKLSTTGGIER